MGIVSGGGEGGERCGQKGGISTRGLVPVKRRTGRPGCCRFGVDATFSVGDVDMLHGDGRRTVDAHDAAPTQTHRARTEYGEGRTRTIGNWGVVNWELGSGTGLREWEDWAAAAAAAAASSRESTA